MFVHYPNYRGLRSAITGRKVPLLQTVICTVFISGTLSLLQFVAGEAKLNHIPDNDMRMQSLRNYHMSDGDLTAQDISPWLSVAGGVIFMLTVILVTVWGNIKGIMRLNPVEYIEKE